MNKLLVKIDNFKQMPDFISYKRAEIWSRLIGTLTKRAFDNDGEFLCKITSEKGVQNLIIEYDEEDKEECENTE